MSAQTFEDDDLAFERALLGAGRAEALPDERTEAALVKLVGSLSALQSATVGSARLDAPRAAWWRRWGATAKALGVGFIAGSAVTFVVLERTTPPPRSAPVSTVSRREATVPVTSGQTAPMSSPGPVDAPAVRPRAAAAPVRPIEKPGTDLAAEIAALDGLRTALAIGAWRDADVQLARYRQIFPHGALQSEAEVLGVELLLAQGRNQAAASAARGFIAKHPRDPQAVRMRALVEPDPR